jgi:hypothetical protein
LCLELNPWCGIVNRKKLGETGMIGISSLGHFRELVRHQHSLFDYFPGNMRFRFWGIWVRDLSFCEGGSGRGLDSHSSSASRVLSSLLIQAQLAASDRFHTE